MSVVVVVNPAEENEKKVRPSGTAGAGNAAGLGTNCSVMQIDSEKNQTETQTSGVTPCETEYELVWPFKIRCREKEKNDAELDSSNIRPT